MTIDKKIRKGKIKAVKGNERRGRKNLEERMEEQKKKVIIKLK